MTATPRDMLDGFEIVDCAVRSAEHFYLVATHVYETDEPRRTEDSLREAIRIAVFLPNAPPPRQWAFRTLRHIELMRCAVAELPASQLVSVSLDGQVFVLGSGTSAFEARIPEHRDGPLRGSVRSLLCVDGMVYAVQGNRGLCRRTGPDRWESLCKKLPVASSWQRRDDDGFNCAAATSASNVYVGGGHGDLWHFDGKSWTDLHFPSNVLIEAMCCLGPDDVYVGCQNGIVYRGRGDRWKKIAEGELTLPFRRMVTCRGRVWCSSDYGIWVIDEDRVQKAALPDEVYVKAGVLAAKGDVLLVAGTNGAAYHDGARWHEMFNYL